MRQEVSNRGIANFKKGEIRLIMAGFPIYFVVQIA